MQSGGTKKHSSTTTTPSAAAAASAVVATAGIRHGWAELPDALLVSILSLLLSLRDLLSFSAVCRSWRLLATAAAPLRHLPPLLLRPLPPLLLPRRRRNPNTTFNLLDPASPHSVAASSPLSPQTLSLPFLGLSHGRLILLLSEPDPHPDSRRPRPRPRPRRRVIIADPLTGAELRTPPLPPPNATIHFGLLTGPLSSPDSSLLLLGYDSLLFQWRPGSPQWLRTPFRAAPTITHIVPFEGRVLAMDDAERIFVIHLAGDADSSVTELEVSLVGQNIAPFSLSRYLIECGDELLLVRFVPSGMMPPLGTMPHLGIEAFRLDRSEPRRWVKMESLGDRALFIGENHKTLGFSCVSPKKWGGESNCIYYACSGNKPWSVLRLGDAAIDLSDPELRLSEDSSRLLRTPKWFYPSLYGGGQGHGASRASELTA